MEGRFRRKKFHLILLILIILTLIIPNTIANAEEEEIIPLGTESWKLPEVHRIYVQEYNVAICLLDRSLP